MVKSVVLLSGGLDSTVTAAVALSRGDAALLHVVYGQRTWTRELQAFNAIADFYGAEKRLVARISSPGEIGGSALTDTGIEVPDGDLGRAGIPATYVPFRNAQMLSIAVSWAEVLGVAEVYMGAVEEDGSGYPDCREVFFKAFEAAVSLGTRAGNITIVTPLIHRRKSAIVRLGTELNAPLRLTWSCYKEIETACGRCDSCLLRLKGFKEAGVEDPIPYKTFLNPA